MAETWIAGEFPEWVKNYAADVAKRNNVTVRIEREKDSRGKFWGQYLIVGQNSGLTLTKIDYKRAKAAGFV